MLKRGAMSNMHSFLTPQPELILSTYANMNDL